jgi:drug/metabolite transporter (DMT)-like permease
MSHDRLGIMLIMAGMSLFSIQDLMIKLLAEQGSLLQIFVLRSLFGGLVILAYLYLSGRSVKISTAYPLLTVIRSTFFFIGFMSFYISLALMPISEATAIFFISPLFITLLSWFFLKYQVGLYRVVAIIVGFVGTALIVKPSTANFDWAYLLPIITALTYAISMIIAKHTRDKDTVFQQTIHMYLASIFYGVLILCVVNGFGLSFDGIKGLEYVFRSWSFTDAKVLLAVMTVSVVGTIGMLCLISAYRIAQPPIIAPFEYSLLVVSIIMGYVAFGEVPDGYSIIGMIMIVMCGMVIFIREEARKMPLVIKIRLR